MTEEDQFMGGLKVGKGCGYGAVSRDKIESNTRDVDNMCITMNKGFDRLDISLKELNSKLFIGIFVVIVLSFLAGLNVWDNLLKLLIK